MHRFLIIAAVTLAVVHGFNPLPLSIKATSFNFTGEAKMNGIHYKLDGNIKFLVPDNSQYFWVQEKRVEHLIDPFVQSVQQHVVGTGPYAGNALEIEKSNPSPAIAVHNFWNFFGLGTFVKFSSPR